MERAQGGVFVPFRAQGFALSGDIRMEVRLCIIEVYSEGQDFRA